MLLGLSLTNCAHKIPDEPICLELNPNKGYCTYTVSDKSYYLLDNEWINQKQNSFYIPITSWGEIKKFIINICREQNQCSQDDENNIVDKINKIESRLP